MLLVVIILFWAIPMLVVALTGSPRAVLVLSGLYLLFLAYRSLVVTGPMASMAILALLAMSVAHILGSLAMFALSVHIRRRLER